MASGNPYEVYSAPPPSLSSATAGMGTSVMPSEKTYGQAIYQRYYALPFALDTVKHAIAASQRNPHVDQATALAADVAAMTKAADARAALVTAEVRKRQAARSQMNAVRLKAAGRSAGGGGFNAKELRLLIDLKGEIGGRISTAEGARLGDSGIKGLRETASKYGTGTGLGTSVAGAIGAAATTVGTNVGPDGMTESQLKLIAQSDADGVAAIRALKVRGTDLEKGDAAYTMAQALREASPGMSEAAAANFAAKTFGLDDAFLATGEGLQYVKNNLEREAKALMPAGKGEGTLLQTDALVDEAIRLQLNRKGGGRGGALGAEQRRQAAQQLSPEERADLKLYLGALQNDGEVVAGEMVSLAGQPARPITDTEIVAGKKAFQKAQKYDAYDAEDAQWFDEDFLRMHADKVDRSDEASEQRRLAFERGSRTPEEIQREMSEEFVRVATAARDLEDYIPLSATGINNGRDAKIIGGASHIARREGSQVFHLDQHHSDRQRRLGGRGPVASTPLRLALKAYQTQGGSEGTGLTPEQMRAAGQVLTNRFRDPEKRTIALQYLLAMQYVNDKSAETGTAVPSTEVGEETALPSPPVHRGSTLPEDYTPQPGWMRRGEAFPDEEVYREALPPTGAGASRAARPAASLQAGDEDLRWLDNLSRPVVPVEDSRLVPQGHQAVLDRTGFSGSAEHLVPDPPGQHLSYRPKGVPLPVGAPSASGAFQQITTNNGNMQPARVQPAVAAGDPRRFVPGALPMSAYGPASSTKPTVVDDIRALYEADMRGEAILPPEVERFIGIHR